MAPRKPRTNIPRAGKMGQPAPSPPIMNVLPNEILHIICSFLPIPDLGNFRLSCKDGASIGARHLVQNIHVMFTVKSFQNLVNISLHPILSKHVSSILYEARYLEDVDQEDFEFEILDHEYEDLDSLAMGGEHVQAETQRAWVAYKEMLDQQRYMKKLNYDASIFAQTMTRFPALKKIEMSSEYCNYSDAFVRAFEATHAVSALMLDGGEIDNEEYIGTRALGCLLVAAGGMQGRLEHLKAHKLHSSFFNAVPMNVWLNSLTNLRHLDLELENHYMFGGDAELVTKAKHKELGRALHVAKHLETIRLCIDGIITDPVSLTIERVRHRPVDWARLVGDGYWPRLRTLELQVVGGNEKHFADFLERHSKTLQVLKWHQMWLDQGELGGWKRLFKHMEKHLCLKEIEFEGIWGQEAVYTLKPELTKMTLTLKRALTALLVEGRGKRPNNRKKQEKKTHVIATRAMRKRMASGNAS